MTYPTLNECPVPLEVTTNDLGMRWQLAIETRNGEQVRELLQTHSHLSQQVIMERWRDGLMGHRSLDPLYQFFQSGHIDIVKQTVAAGYGRSKLPGAIELASPEIAAYLVDDLGAKSESEHRVNGLHWRT